MMIAKESVIQFRERHAMEYAGFMPVQVCRLEDYNRKVTSTYRRRDFYKLMLFEKANGMIKFADKTVPVTNHALVLTSSMVPYLWEGEQQKVKGYLCVFTEAFITTALASGAVADTALFKPGANPVLYPDALLYNQMTATFEGLLAASRSAYQHKLELMRNYIQIILHQALQASPAEASHEKSRSYQRIVDLFLSLLERQFPVGSPGEVTPLKNAGEFASRLGIHTNHLNKALRGCTGKTTTQHIAAHITREAKSLLLNSSWPIAEIAACLGFNHVTNFHLFFKQQTGITPRQFQTSRGDYKS